LGRLPKVLGVGETANLDYYEQENVFERAEAKGFTHAFLPMTLFWAQLDGPGHHQRPSGSRLHAERFTYVHRRRDATAWWLSLGYGGGLRVVATEMLPVIRLPI
jgi:hypothetical protein